MEGIGILKAVISYSNRSIPVFSPVKSFFSFYVLSPSSCYKEFLEIGRILRREGRVALQV